MATQVLIAADTPNTLNLTELQHKIIQSINHFSKIQRLRVEQNEFVQAKLNIISEQRNKFLDFAEKSITQCFKISSHSRDIILFAEFCDDDGISKEELLEFLYPVLSNARLSKVNSELLKKLLVEIKQCLEKMSSDIVKYDDEITKRREELHEKIEEVDEIENDAKSNAKFYKGISTVGAAVALAAAPFTGGASLAAEAIVGFGAAAYFGGEVVSTGHDRIAKVYSVHSDFLKYLSKEVREELSQCLSEMSKCLIEINKIITYCESYWEREIESIETIITNLNRCITYGRRMIKGFAVSISSMTRQIQNEANNYCVVMREAVNVNRISG
ncbi:5276_t:CDS:2 [Funneliformis caledonium]|uniref:5276_t:CDS:1 n=1 Tax=Funneliformis caledonium TaxID=1117310 RepID=A0A9N9HSD9_9GLOM|nr:5276_t:CDS:2 [Funneliformis caledonium]